MFIEHGHGIYYETKRSRTLNASAISLERKKIMWFMINFILMMKLDLVHVNKEAYQTTEAKLKSVPRFILQWAEEKKWNHDTKSSRFNV